MTNGKLITLRQKSSIYVIYKWMVYSEIWKNKGNAVIAPLTGRTGFISGTLSYSAILNNLNASELLAGNLYIDIHNATYPNGEIRGQINLYCANSFVWNPDNLAGQTVTVSPTTSTTYTVTGTGANGCIGTSNVAVIICS
jgi:hypothetical protein